MPSEGEGATAPPPAGPPGEPPPPPRRARLTWVHLAALLLLFSIFAAEVYLGVVRPTDAAVAEVRAFLAATANGDLAAARARLTEPYRRQVTEARLAAMIAERPDFFGARGASFPNRKIKRDLCTLKGTLEGPSGTAIPCAFELLREEGSWRIAHLTWSPAER